jgi:uncharacterized membrane protein YhhN
MTTLAWVLVALAGVFAVVDWWARWRTVAVAEYITKPAVTILITLAAVALDPSDETMRWWFVTAFVLCLVGDVTLMLDLFEVGLGAFLLAHLTFVGGFVAGGVDGTVMLLVVAVAMVVLLATVGRRIRAGAGKDAVPVTIYLGAITAMALAAAAHGNGWGIAGGVIFVVSDSILGWDRFVHRLAAAPVAVMVTYHIALACLLISLV